MQSMPSQLQSGNADGTFGVTEVGADPLAESLANLDNVLQAQEKALVWHSSVFRCGVVPST